MRLVLASASPRRAELLATAGFTFEVDPVDVDETPHRHEAPIDYVRRVARDKAAAWRIREDGRRAKGCTSEPPDPHTASPWGTSPCVLTADTVVVAEGRILGKPVDASHAREMLTLLSGTTHMVHTGVVLGGPGGEVAEVETTRVRFVNLSDAEIDWYLQTGEAEGKAGAYAIQGRASRFVARIEGSWSNVVGLPVATVYRMLAAAGVLS